MCVAQRTSLLDVSPFLGIQHIFQAQLHISLAKASISILSDAKDQDARSSQSSTPCSGFSFVQVWVLIPSSFALRQSVVFCFCFCFVSCGLLCCFPAQSLGFGAIVICSCFPWSIWPLTAPSLARGSTILFPLAFKMQPMTF